MPDLVHWKKRQLKQMREEFDTLFQRLRQDFCPPILSFPRQPNFEIKEDNDQLVVQCNLPELEKDDLQVNVSDDSLLIKGYQHREILWETGGVNDRSSFITEIKLPCKIDTDHVKACLKESVLTIYMKKRATTVMKQVDIKRED